MEVIVLGGTCSKFPNCPEGVEERSFMETTSIKNMTVHNRGPEET